MQKVATPMMQELRRHQVYRLQRPQRRPMIARLRRALRNRFFR
jgi:hypothetical protein